MYYKEALQNSNYGKALQLFKMRKYKEAKIYFQELLKSEDSKYMEKGRFYLGKIYKIKYIKGEVYEIKN